MSDDPELAGAAPGLNRNKPTRERPLSDPDEPDLGPAQFADGSTATPFIEAGVGRDDTAETEEFLRRAAAVFRELPADALERGDAKLLWRASDELRAGLTMFRCCREKRTLALFGSARIPKEHPRYKQAEEFGREMAQAGYMVITGAGPGIMEAGHAGAGRAASIGLNIRLPFEQEANPVIRGDAKLVNFHYFFTRKLFFLKGAAAAAFFPGGFGTLDEAFETLTLVQTGKAPLIPIVMLDVPGGTYWESLLQFLQRELAEPSLISPEDTHLFRVVHSTREAIDEIQTFYRVYDSQRYVRGNLTLRLKKPIGDALLEKIRAEFADLLIPGTTRTFQRGMAHQHEANEPEVLDLPRLYFPFNRHSHGRLRQLIDLINREA